METVNEIVDELLLMIWPFQELDEFRLTVVEAVHHLVTLSLDIRHDDDAVLDVATCHLFPDFDLVLTSVGDPLASLTGSVHISLRYL